MKRNRIYQSFEEIESDLKILRLKKEIDWLQLKNSTSNFTDSLAPKSLIANAFSNVGGDFFKPKNRWFGLIVDYALYYFFKKK